MKLTNNLKKNLSFFSTKLLHWHQTINKRTMPWKGIKDVYRIWLSEIILQQTRVEQGLAYYEKIVAQYPTVHDLAAAPLESVMKLWEGLGYYSRCRNLHATAKQVAVAYQGVFPDTYEGLLQLKGVGPYTAAAIASFAYNLPVPVVDGNVFRVLSRFFGVNTAIDSTAGKKQFWSLASQCIDESQPALYNQAIMDFGATVCKPLAPKCDSCPLQKKCIAFQTNQVTSLPVTEKIIRKRNRWFIYFIIEQKGKFLISKRTGKDIWSNLYEFPKLEAEKGKDFTNILNAIKQTCNEPRTRIKMSANDLPSSYVVSKILEGNPQKEITSLMLPAQIYQQALTHQNIRAAVAILSLSSRVSLPLEGEWKSVIEIQSLPFPKIIRDILSAYPLK